MSVKPEDIPQEIWDAADAIADSSVELHTRAEIDDLATKIARAIMAAVEKEREACAKVCTEYRYEWKQVGDKYASLIRNRQSKDG